MPAQLRDEVAGVVEFGRDAKVPAEGFDVGAQHGYGDGVDLAPFDVGDAWSRNAHGVSDLTLGQGTFASYLGQAVQEVFGGSQSIVFGTRTELDEMIAEIRAILGRYDDRLSDHSLRPATSRRVELLLFAQPFATNP